MFFLWTYTDLKVYLKCWVLSIKLKIFTETNWLPKVGFLHDITKDSLSEVMQMQQRKVQSSPWITSEQSWHKSQHNSSAEGWQRSVAGVKPSRGTQTSELWTNASTHPLAPRPLPHSIFWHQILDLLYTFYVSPQVFQIFLWEGGLVFSLSSNLSAWVCSVRPRNTEADSMLSTASVEHIKDITFDY